MRTFSRTIASSLALVASASAVALCTALIAAPCIRASSPIVQRVTVWPPEGWVSNGYGEMHFEYDNTGTGAAKVVKWTGTWLVDGVAKHTWDWDAKIDVLPGATAKGSLTAWMPPQVAAVAYKRCVPVINGTTIVEFAGGSIAVPYSVNVPVYALPGKMKLVKGTHVGLRCQEPRFASLSNLARTVSFLDSAYVAMHELTGYTPFNGELMVLEETARFPAWAYAGNPVSLNTEFVPESLREMDRGEVCFGWLHEMGHNFDFGGWYIWNGPAAETHGNLKLAYAIETLVTPSSPLRIKSWRAQPDGTKPLVEGKRFNDSFYVPAGDAYLADKARTWDSMASDDIHAMFMTFVRKHGWNCLKTWYRTYAALEAAKLPMPESTEDKIRLACAIMSEATGADATPEFLRWRLPVRKGDVAALRAKYQLAKLSAYPPNATTRSIGDL